MQCEACGLSGARKYIAGNKGSWVLCPLCANIPFDDMINKAKTMDITEARKLIAQENAKKRWEGVSKEEKKKVGAMLAKARKEKKALRERDNQ